MASSEPIIIGSNTFRTKKEAKEYYRSMRARYGLDERIQGADADDVAALLMRHLERDQKVGVGVAYFIATLGRGHGTPCFAIVRIDGSKEDLSYHNSIDLRVRIH